MSEEKLGKFEVSAKELLDLLDNLVVCSIAFLTESFESATV